MAKPVALAGLGILIAAPFALVGCPREVAISLCNHSDSQAVIEFQDSLVPLAPLKCVQVDYYSNNYTQWQERAQDNARVPVMNIRYRGRRLYYLLDIFPLPEGYVDETGGIEVFLQLHSDERLYLATSEHSLDREQLERQPIGFPIRAVAKP
jgi:hypothetical protein